VWVLLPVQEAQSMADSFGHRHYRCGSLFCFSNVTDCFEKTNIATVTQGAAISQTWNSADIFGSKHCHCTQPAAIAKSYDYGTFLWMQLFPLYDIRFQHRFKLWVRDKDVDISLRHVRAVIVWMTHMSLEASIVLIPSTMLGVMPLIKSMRGAVTRRGHILAWSLYIFVFSKVVSSYKPNAVRP
jgi:hypothetical protein